MVYIIDVTLRPNVKNGAVNYRPGEDSKTETCRIALESQPSGDSVR